MSELTDLLTPLHVWTTALDPDVVVIALHVATSALPLSQISLRAKVDGVSTKNPIIHIRDIDFIYLQQPGTARASLQDRVRGRKDILAVRRWTLVLAPADGPATKHPTPETPGHYLLSLSHFALSAGGVPAGPQLALTRAQFTRALRCADPDVRFAGGQTEWHDSWWNSRGTPQSATT